MFHKHFSTAQLAGSGTSLVELRANLPAASWWREANGQSVRAYAVSASVGDGWEKLEALDKLEGASVAHEAECHYVVETDIPASAEADFNAWYTTEHLPGLARVPGTVQARRYRRVTGSPRYLACYDLLSPAVMERDEWLAVRHTPWSARVRPLFNNTRRTLYVRCSGGAT